MKAKEVEVGKKYLFKVHSGRGRPFVGEVVKKQGAFTEMKTREKIVKIKNDMIHRPYEYRSYKKRVNGSPFSFDVASFH